MYQNFAVSIVVCVSLQRQKKVSNFEIEVLLLKIHQNSINIKFVNFVEFLKG